jgi:hypothetical protein
MAQRTENEEIFPGEIFIDSNLNLSSIFSNLKQNHHPPPSESETKFHLNLFKSVHSLERSFLEKSSWIVTEQSLLDQGTFSETALVVNRFSDCVKMYG